MLGTEQILFTSRTPQGVRGLKLTHFRFLRCLESRTPQGVRGLKLHADPPDSLILSRTPQGVRGLKLGTLEGG